jgi:hypothetical protein
MDQVGAFTRLAEEKRIKVIVPPISSASTEERTRVYDFTNYRDLVAFQDKMREAYGYIEGHVKYMHLCQQNKADKGGYDGRALLSRERSKTRSSSSTNPGRKKCANSH